MRLLQQQQNISLRFMEELAEHNPRLDISRDLLSRDLAQEERLSPFRNPQITSLCNMCLRESWNTRIMVHGGDCPECGTHDWTFREDQTNDNQ